MILFGYIGVGAVLFHKWENWDVTTAAYFSFITLTTIGFGDYSPIKSFEGIDEVGAGGEEFIKLIFSTLYCAIGKLILDRKKRNEWIIFPREIDSYCLEEKHTTIYLAILYKRTDI